MRLRQAGELAAQNFRTEIPFEYEHDHIYIKARLNGSEKEYRFLVDTGAGTLLREHLANELGLEAVNEMRIGDVCGVKKKLGYTKLDTIEIGGLAFKNVGAAILKVVETPEAQCLRELGDDRDGIIGCNIMKLATWQINYDEKKIIITDDRESLSYLEGAHTVPFRQYGLAMVADFGMKRKKLGFMVIDTGCSYSLVGHSEQFQKLRKGNPDPYIKGSGQAYSGLYGGCEDRIYISQIYDFQVGNLKVKKIPMAFGSHPAYLLGNGFLKHFIVTFDWGEKELKLYKIPETTIRTSYYSFGLGYQYRDGQVRVSFLWENSPATEAGLQIGDRIIQINGKDVSALIPDEYCDFLFESDDLDTDKAQELNLVVLKDGREENMVLRKADLFKRES